MAKNETQEGAKAPEASEKTTEAAKKKYIVHRLRNDMKGPIYAYDGLTGEGKTFDEGKEVELTEHMVAGLKDATFQTTVLVTDEKTGQQRSELILKRSYSLEEA